MTAFSTARFCLLVVAKAPVPGQAKTRLCPPATPEQAAGIAAAALLDTLTTVLQTPRAAPVVAMTGHLSRAPRDGELRGMLASTRIITQRGADFAERLVHAHADAALCWPGLPVLQIGMDTPQVTPELLAETAGPLARPAPHAARNPFPGWGSTCAEAVLGPASDGGWWALGLRDPRHAEVLGDVAMSRADTGRRTCEALRREGLAVTLATTLSDVDDMPTATRVAATVPASRFAAAVADVTASLHGI
ncbi:TIGR04282 family arsenosugar biosynthesis glycosyltransferase [Amycolatopsis taiwanensis]|uniref:DUF2064 domain-containing protein n=1 Tax=Amycolatopsis taiwanensis TaxID=342230 RepID=A0A9W6RB17_9PSEU|nr:DUF2064 domain-containing protein [Amycolatopsis taiwanensis]GLY70817.1 hypothetical protein Atai01_74360 [Amycolatopsis taiwanensis]